MAQVLQTLQRDIPCKVNFIAQIPVIPKCVLISQMLSGMISVRRDWAKPFRKQAFFSSNRDVAGPSVYFTTVHALPEIYVKHINVLALQRRLGKY